MRGGLGVCIAFAMKFYSMVTEERKACLPMHFLFICILERWGKVLMSARRVGNDGMCSEKNKKEVLIEKR